MLEAALRFPLASDDRVSTLLIGGALLAVSLFASTLAVLFVPFGLLVSLLVFPVSLVVQGYLVRVLRGAATGDRAAPSFTDWGGLLVDGLKLLFVSLVYGLVVVVPLVVLVVVGVGSFTVTGGVESGMGMETATAAAPTVTGPNAAVSAGLLVGVGVVFLLSLVVSYLLPAALTNFALRDSLSAAFDLGTLRQVVFSTDYLLGVLLGYVVGGALAGVAAGFSLLLVGIPALFYAQVFTYYCFGRGFAEARESMAPGTERV